jgi:hypothetical protein
MKKSNKFLHTCRAIFFPDSDIRFFLLMLGVVVLAHLLLYYLMAY